MCRWSTVVLAAFALALSGSVAHAHGVWVEKRYDKHRIVLGEGAVDNAYPAGKVVSVTGYDAEGRAAEVRLLPQADHVVLDVADGVAAVATTFDHGYWCKDAEGKWVNKPAEEVPGASGGHATIKYNIAYLKAAITPVTVPGFAIQIVPEVNPASLGMCDMLKVQVLRDGKPLPGVKVMLDVVNNPEATVETDADGKASVAVRNSGLNVLGVEESFSDDGKETAYFTSLSFVCGG